MLKFTLNLLIIFLAIPAFSCPELQGNFDCATQDDSGPVNSFSIGKGTEGGQVIYQINGTKLVANGIPETRNKGDGFPTTYTTSCEGQSLRARMQTHVSSAFCPSLPLAVDSITVFTIKGTDIEMDDQTILSCPDKAPTNIRHIYTCKRK
ncbi:hypothetical protein B9G69_004915 [Bdellovibrio sp. SKB1291214]|uniref:hypothetical protein n=1 Tax=Bdellovibrio sp. SKB1291214 TaxID=1732569 RepID=UPI000B519E7E|nr:hypothetical protein [Bdellovibrio sp. SKB1291214]UYL09915.1 hypothetical protein B9G69_004915 [Bdellovibrio sp. SKB1291214]